MLCEDKVEEPWQKWHGNWTLSNKGLQQIQEIDSHRRAGDEQKLNSHFAKRLKWTAL